MVVTNVKDVTLEQVNAEEYDNGVSVVNICRLIDALYGEMSWKRFTYQEISEGIKKWITAYDAYYYAKCKEDFFLWEALDEATKAGKSIVVMENLS